MCRHGEAEIKCTLDNCSKLFYDDEDEANHICHELKIKNIIIDRIPNALNKFHDISLFRNFCSKKNEATFLELIEKIILECCR